MEPVHVRFLAMLAMAVAGAATMTVEAGTISQELVRVLAHSGTHADVAVIVHFSNPLDLKPLAVGDRSQRDNRLMVALKGRALQNRIAIDTLLQDVDASRVKDLWMSQSFAATVPANLIKKLAAHRNVDRVDPDSFVQGGRPQRTPPSRVVYVSPTAQDGISAVRPRDAVTVPTNLLLAAKAGWNIAAVQAPEVWARGYSGQGVVVASMDTGADLSHPDLSSKWRGGSNSWFDPHGEQSSPYDATGHGTQALGVMAGGPGISVAPNVRWISTRLFNSQGRASMSDIHLVFQWLLDPDGDPATLDAPDVVNASWALSGRGVGSCILEFSDDIHVLRSAGIAVVFAAGNDGPLPGTSNSPGNNPGVVSVGAVDRDLEVSRQTSRGPSNCAGAAFPTLVAPGVNVRTADLSHGGQLSYTTVSGSSLAAPHVSGVLALLAGAFPTASVDELETALVQGAQVLKPVPESDHRRDSYRHLDALAAFNLLLKARQSVSSGAASDN